MSDKTTPTVGKLLSGTEQRDAIHFALAPVQAAEAINPGQDVGLDCYGMASGRDVKMLGKADPFLQGIILEGQWFWLFLYPNTITSLRHEWEHPDFPGPQARITAEDIAASKKWLEDFACQIELSYEQLMQAAENWLERDDYHVFSYNTPDCAHGAMRDFWRHYQIVTGKVVKDDEANFFTCVC